MDDGSTDGDVNKDKSMLRERRPTASNHDELLQLMAKTRNMRRAWIAASNPTITEIYREYPRLVDMPDAVRVSFFLYCLDICSVN